MVCLRNRLHICSYVSVVKDVAMHIETEVISELNYFPVFGVAMRVYQTDDA